jgi:hypothetical protein
MSDTQYPAESSPEKRIALFQRKEVRRVIHNNEWWFVIIDVVAALTDSVNPKGYFTDMRRREPQLAEALKGGGKLPPPLASNSTRQADARCFNAGILKASSASSNPFPAPRLSRSNAGSRASAIISGNVRFALAMAFPRDVQKIHELAKILSDKTWYHAEKIWQRHFKTQFVKDGNYEVNISKTDDSFLKPISW